MATVLLTWELGAGLGHTTLLRPVAEGLVERGHRVVAALKDVSRANLVFGGTRVSYLQAPSLARGVRNAIDPACTFAHILHNTGFGDEETLTGLAEAWRTLFEHLRPDMIVCDHSPVALLAARGYGMKRVLFGMGFCCPPDCYPLPDWRPAAKADPQRLRADEDHLLEAINRQLDRWQLDPLRRVTDLYSQCDETMLITFAELDHFGPRPDATYWGVWPSAVGRLAEWPAGEGPRVYAYLKPFPGLATLLQVLVRRGDRVLIYGDTIPRSLRERFASESLRFVDSPIDLTQRDAYDVAILNATHATTAAVLLAGKPMLLVPNHLEQHLVARNAVRLEAALAVRVKASAGVFAGCLDALLHEPCYREAAQRFAARYAHLDPAEQNRQLTARLDALARA